MNNNPTVLEINLSSLKYNLDFFRSRISDQTKMLAVIKASGYGSDSIALAQFLEKQDINYFAVAYADEGIAIRKAGVKTPILVLHPQTNNLKLLIEYNLEPNLYSLKILDTFLQIASDLQLEKYPVHIKFNTGLNRLGFNKSALNLLYHKLKDDNKLVIKSIFSHLAASEDPKEKDFTLAQINTFKGIANNFKSLFGYRPILHMTNTSGILNYPEAHFDMVRLGIGLYGFGNEPKVTSELKNVLSLKSIISQIHVVEKGDSIGYNRDFFAKSKRRTATLPIGHADGLFRRFGKGSISVKINGQKAPVIGNVCMDMIMIDITGIPCEEGDEVVLFDNQNQINEMAEKAQTINYEILTSFSSRINRKIL